MNHISVNNPFRRLILVLTPLIVISLIALVPTYLASQFIDKPKSIDSDIARLTTVAEPGPGLNGATVTLNTSMTNPVPSKLTWYSADIIRNGVLISEDFVRPGDVMTVGPADTPIFRNLPTDSDECATILQLYPDELAEQRPGWYLVYIEVSDDDSSTVHRCSIPMLESAE